METTTRLVRQTGEDAEYPLDAEVIRLGRERARTVAIDDPQVSRHHAEITCSEEREAVATGDLRRAAQTWVITDLGSTNGTYVNETLLAGGRSLRVGDCIRLGNTLFTFEAMESGRLFRNVAAVLLAISTLAVALIAWRASVAWDNSAEARSTGTSVLVRDTQSRTQVEANLYRSMDAFTAYRWRLVMADRITADQSQFTDTPAADGSPLPVPMPFCASQVGWLEGERLRYANAALTALSWTNPYYLSRADSPEQQTFDKTRFFETSIAEAASRQDLDHEAHFDRADREALAALRLTLAAVPVSLSIFFYTGATLSRARGRWKYLLLLLGVAGFGLGSLAAGWIEVAGRLG